MHERQQKLAAEESTITLLETASLSREALHTILHEILMDGQPIHITVTGSSMQPFLRHARDRICLAPCDPNEIKRGDIILYIRDDGSWVMHRVYRALDGLFTMIGDGQWILEPNIGKHQVIAKALYAVRDGKKISCQNGARNTMMKLYLYRMCAPGFFRAIVDGKEALKTLVKKIIRHA